MDSVQRPASNTADDDGGPMTADMKGMSIMLDAKNARKRAESDVQLLANRLQHLRIAEERARKKIGETKASFQRFLCRTPPI